MHGRAPGAAALRSRGWHGAWCWDEHFLDFFADKGFRAVAVSLRGHGASTLPQSLNSVTLPTTSTMHLPAVDMLGSEPALIGHSLGCFVVQSYLEKHDAPAAVLLEPATPRGMRRSAMHMFRRNPWIFVRASTFGNSADLVSTPALCRASCSAPTPPNQ